MPAIQELNKRFGLSENLLFTTSSNNTPIAKVNTSQCSAQIALQGAQVFAWLPAGEQAVIWLSEQAVFAPGKSIRGGVPVCWPWFGPHAARKDFPAHGFARTVDWSVMQSKLLDDGRVYLVFELKPDVAPAGMWPEGARLELHMKFGRSLELALISFNDGKQPLTISEALHTYFAVGDVRQVQITGLENTEYLDKVAGSAGQQQTGAVTINSEVDRVYLDTESECVIDDAAWKRKIHIQKSGSRSTVVWNPWHEKAQAMGDLGQDGYLSMLCVESANALHNTVAIPPGKSHNLTVNYSVTSN